MKNQYLYASCLAQFDIEEDTFNLDLEGSDTAEEAFLKNLERRYPQVCEDCQPRALERMRTAVKTAKTEHLGVILARSRARREADANRSWTNALSPKLGFMWFIGLVGQLLRNIMRLIAMAHRHPQISDILAPALVMKIVDSVISVSTLSSSQYWIAWCCLSTFLWNTRFQDIWYGIKSAKGIGRWYKLQIALIMSEVASFYMMNIDVLPERLSPPRAVAHVLLLIITVTVSGSLFKSHKFLTVSSYT